MGLDSVIKIIGILFVLMAVLYLLRPEVLKRLIEFFKKGKRMYFAALVRFILAIIFLLGARECDITWVIASFGILFIISGLLIFIIGLEKVKAILDWYQKQSLLLLRVLALITLAIGAIVLYSA